MADFVSVPPPFLSLIISQLVKKPNKKLYLGPINATPRLLERTNDPAGGSATQEKDS
jgi:hypothetical protein